MIAATQRAFRESIVPWVGRQWREWRGYFFFFCFVWIPLRSAVIDYNPVPSGSMNPTILEGDVVWVNKLAYGLRIPLTTVHVAQWADPQRGDIVVVLSPADGTRLVKRVVGIPGDTLSMRNNQLILNGRPTTYAVSATDYTSMVAQNLRAQAFFAEEDLGGVSHAVMGLADRPSPARTFESVTIPAEGYFLMGDSRAYGVASRDDVLGRAEGVLVSLDINDTYLPRFRRFFTPLR